MLILYLGSAEYILSGHTLPIGVDYVLAPYARVGRLLVW